MQLVAAGNQMRQTHQLGGFSVFRALYTELLGPTSRQTS